MRYEKGTKIWVSWDSADLGIEDYNVRVSTSGVVEVAPTANGRKMLVTLDEIDGDHNVCVAINADAKGISLV